MNLGIVGVLWLGVIGAAIRDQKAEAQAFSHLDLTLGDRGVLELGFLRLALTLLIYIASPDIPYVYLFYCV